MSGGGSGSTAQRFADRLASLNSADGLSSALGFIVSTARTQVVTGTAIQQLDGFCPLGYCDAPAIKQKTPADEPSHS